MKTSIDRAAKSLRGFFSLVERIAPPPPMSVMAAELKYLNLLIELEAKKRPHPLDPHYEEVMTYR